MTRLRHPELTVTRAALLFKRLCTKLLADSRSLDLEIAGPMERLPREEALRRPFRPARLGEELGPPWSTFWLKLCGEIPREWHERTVVLRFSTGSEALLWLNGEPFQGFNGEANGPFNDGGRAEAVLPDSIARYGRFEAEVEIACNGLWGAPGGGVGSPNSTRYKLYEARLVLRDDEAWALAHDLVVIIKWLQDLPEWKAQADLPAALKRLPPWPGRVLKLLDEFCNQLDTENRATWPEARQMLADILAHRNGTFAHRITAVGHAHIDTAWLWPIDESIRKCARSFSNALRLAERYPAFRFACSQALHYVWMKNHYPSLYAQIKATARRGQWIPVGGSWVEPDFNLPSGESLVRQFLYGQRFFKHEFGAYCRECWSPDAFGFPASLPQILRGAGIAYFLTQKLSWNQFNKPLHNTFHWEGLDGSRVLAHFPPANTYNAMTGDDLVRHLLTHEQGAMDHDRVHEGLLLFGYGDGGGGPTEHMVEVITRLEDVQGFPRVSMDRPDACFARLAKSLDGDAPVHVGELYLEYHRGTYTTQASIKRANRQCERLLRDVEQLASVATSAGAPYPSEELAALWKVVLTNQFHDILPGSSIREVYERARREFAETEKELARLLEAAAQIVAPNRATNGKTLFNTLGWARRGVVEVEPGALHLLEAPPCGYAPDTPRSPKTGPARAAEESGRWVLENGLLRAEFDARGRLLRLFDRTAQRDALGSHEPSHRLRLYDDYPHAWDAWELDPTYRSKFDELEAQSAAVVTSGPLRAEIAFDYAFGASRMRVVARLDADSPILEFESDADWHERHRLLKVELPVAVRAPDAAFDIAFGHVRRPTHFNTPYDIARFESPAHFWCDLSEPGYGVALLNDCKYGHSVHSNVLGLSLLRAPTYPDPEADQGPHHFRYALYPHTGSLVDAQVVRRAIEFNSPFRILQGSVPGPLSWFGVDSPHVILETVKKAEDSEALIVRLYECHGARGSATLRTSLPFERVARVNLLEEEAVDLPDVDAKAGLIRFEFRPFEIISLRLERGSTPWIR